MAASQEQPNPDDKGYGAYLDERRVLVSAELEISSRFDKGILTLSGGALLLSMTFVKEIAAKPYNAHLLVWSWLLLAAAICMMLLSLLASQSALRRARAILDERLSQPQTSCRNCWARITHILNIASIVAFIAALVFLVLFVSANVPGK